MAKRKKKEANAVDAVREAVQVILNILGALWRNWGKWPLSVGTIVVLSALVVAFGGVLAESNWTILMGTIVFVPGVALLAIGLVPFVLMGSSFTALLNKVFSSLSGENEGESE